jgi:hypothetical protein
MSKDITSAGYASTEQQLVDSGVCQRVVLFSADNDLLTSVLIPRFDSPPPKILLWHQRCFERLFYDGNVYREVPYLSVPTLTLGGHVVQ